MKWYIFLIIGIFLVGIVSSVAFGLNKADFTEKIHKINAKKLCDKDKDITKIERKECKDLKNVGYEINLSNTNIEIKQNPDDVLMVRYKE